MIDINKLNKDERLEYLIKFGIIKSKFHCSIIINFMFGFAGIFLMVMDMMFLGIFYIIIFVVGMVTDIRRLNMGTGFLSDEYFKIEPRRKKK